MKNFQDGFHPIFHSVNETVLGAACFGAEDFRKEVCEVFDLLMDKGMDRNLAIKRTREILKAANYPFVTYDTVITRLRASGRFKKNTRK
jgi:hypothetical protein